MAGKLEVQTDGNGAGVALARVSREGHYLWSNKRFAALTGVALDQLVGQQFSALLPIAAPELAGEFEIVASGDAPCRELLVFAASLAQPDSAETWLVSICQSDDGQHVEFAALRDPVKGDVTGADGHRSLYEALEAIPPSVCILYPDGDVIYANAAWLRAFGQVLNEDSLLNFLDLVDLRDRTTVAGLLADPERVGERFSCEARLSEGERSDDWFLLEANLGKDRDDGSPFWFVSCTDINQLKRTQQRLSRRTESLLNEDRRKDEFLAILGHELRNPMAAMEGALVSLEMGQSERRDWAMSVLRDQLDQMAGLVNNLLDDARIRRGKVTLDLQPVDVASVITASAETVRQEADAKQVAIKLNVPRAPLAVMADRTRIEQVVVNLLSNAVRYTQPEGWVRVDAFAHGDLLVIKVADNGIGISPDLIDDIFDPFAQAPTGDQGNSAGLGVGLTLVKELVSHHGGTIEVFSEGEGCGSEFVINLPGICSADELPETRSERKPSEPLAGLKVLLVDDNEAAAVGLATLLEASGTRPRLAATGEEGLALASSESFDALVLDIGLPDMDGFELMAEILARCEQLAGVRVALTGFGHERARKDAIAAGFTHHMVKPADFRELAEILAGAGRED